MSDKSDTYKELLEAASAALGIKPPTIYLLKRVLCDDGINETTKRDLATFVGKLETVLGVDADRAEDVDRRDEISRCILAAFISGIGVPFGLPFEDLIKGMSKNKMSFVEIAAHKLHEMGGNDVAKVVSIEPVVSSKFEDIDGVPLAPGPKGAQ